MIRSIFASFSLCAGMVLIAGCGGNDAPKSVPISEVRKSALLELGELLKNLAAEKKRAPTKMAELEPYEPMIPTAGVAIRNKDIIYIWGRGYVASGSNIVAYDKDAETGGGLALIEDATVKEVSADAIKSAKAGKK